MEEIKLPELGENIETVDVSAVLVAVGDSIRRDQPVVEVETEKASLEVPAPAAGKITELLVSKGDQITVGQVVVRIETGAGETQEVAEAQVAAGGAEAVQAEPTAAAPLPEQDDAPVVTFPAKHKPKIGRAVPAAPSARALARQLGVDINEVPGRGPGGRISRGDVKTYVKSLVQGGVGAAPSAPGAAPTLPDFSQWGEIEREPLTNIRRATAANMSNAWTTVPHVTQFDRADVTIFESLRRDFNRRPEASGVKLTVTALALKVAAMALRRFPAFNASLDARAGEVLYKDFVHVGVAVDTERGLLVPVVRDVDGKSLRQVAAELDDLATRARERKLKPDEMAGATFTVSNLGGLGTTYFSPIVNWPEVAILGVGRAAPEAVFQDGGFVPRALLPLSLSYDHRLIDGADAARFLRWIAKALEQPLLPLLDAPAEGAE